MENPMSEPTATTAPEAAPAAPPKPPKDERNGVVRPGNEGKCGKVWGIADALSDKAGRPAHRVEVVKACVDAGLEAATASTQFGRWRQYWGLPKEPRKESAAAARESGAGQVDEAGNPLPVAAKESKPKAGSKRSAKNGTAAEGRQALEVVSVVDPAPVAVSAVAAE